MATVSVIIPSHNRGASLQRAIASVLRQTFQDFELVVVDDASSDDTPEVVRRFASSKVKYIRHEGNKGVSAARNTGLLNSTGEYIAFLDDDDEWLPEKLERQVARIESSPKSVGAVYTSSLTVDRGTGRVVSRYTASFKGNVLESMFGHGAIAPTSTFLCRRACFEKVGLFDPSLDYGEDFDMWLRIARDFEFDYIDEPLIRYTLPHTNGSSLSRNYNGVIAGTEAYLQRYSELFLRHRAVHGLSYVRLGVLYCLNNEMKKGRAAFRKAMRINAFERRAYLNLFLSLLGARGFKRVKTLMERSLTRS